MIRVVAVFTAFLSGSLLGIALSQIRMRLRQIEEQARKVADALSRHRARGRRAVAEAGR